MNICKLNLIIFLITIVLFSNTTINSQPLIRNDQSKGGTIDNSRGVIIFKRTGSLIDLPGYIGGTVIFESKDKETEQVVPNITYNKLIFNSVAWLTVDSFSNTPHASKVNLRVLDSFIVSSGSESKIRNNYVEIQPNANVRTNGAIKGRKDVAMMNVFNEQSIHGEDNASFTRLRIENIFGVDVKGEFSVTDRLELRQGELRNSKGNVKIGDASIDRSFNTIENIANDTTMGYYEENGELKNARYLDHPKIIRWSGASIETRGDFQEYSTDLEYKGVGKMYTGGENPPPDKTIWDLTVNDTRDSLILTENMRAIDSIYIATHVHTTEFDTLTLSSAKNVEYDLTNAQSEIHGHFRRTDWKDGDEIILNNPYTSILFNQYVSKDELNVLLSSVFPGKYQPLPGGGVTKVKRSLSLRGYNNSGEEYQNQIDASYNYGWRYQGNFDETFNLAFQKLILLHYGNNGSWLPNISSVKPPKNNAPHRWGYSYTTSLLNFGDYAIGTEDASYNLAFGGRAFLEGAYRWQMERMSNELQLLNYLPMPPPDIYPYNLDPNRVFYQRPDKQFPDSVVDWVLVEFRKEYAIEGYKKIMLLRTDGRIVDMWGNEQVFFHSNGEFLEYDTLGQPILDSISDENVQLYVIVRHRNHSAVISDKPIEFTAGQTMLVDFTNAKNVMGGVNSLKPIARLQNKPNEFLWSMIAGDISEGSKLKPDGIINKADYQRILDLIPNWSISTLDGYLLEDVNLSGTVNTLDYNIIFNNRGRNNLLVP